MKILKKHLQSVNNNLKALAKKVDGMIVTVEKLEKQKTVKKAPVKKVAVKKAPVKKAPVKKAAAKKAPVKKAPVKKAAAKKAPVKKVAVKKPAVKKPVKLTAADTVFGSIKRYKKGVGVSALMEKTGFNKRKIYDNVKILKKQGKIKSAGIGVYVKA